MWLLAIERERRQRVDEAIATRTRDLLRAALARHISETPVWAFGSLVAPGRFHEWSDVDVALEWLPSGMTLEYLQSLLSADVGREADVCLINRTRLKPTIERSGERWIAYRFRSSRMAESRTAERCGEPWAFSGIVSKNRATAGGPPQQPLSRH